MLEMHVRNADLSIVLVDRLLRTTKAYKNSNKQEIHDMFIKTNEIKLAFNMTWLIKIVRIA